MYKILKSAENCIYDYVVHNKSLLVKIIVILLLFFGGTIHIKYASDTYDTFAKGFYQVATGLIIPFNGRFVIGFIYIIFGVLGLSNEAAYYTSVLGGIIILGLALVLYAKMLEEYGLSENKRVLLAFGVIANVFIVEYFCFVETIGYMLGVLFNVLSARQLVLYFKNKKKKAYISAILFVILAFFTYQGTIALFIVLVMPFVYYYSKDIQEYLIYIFRIGIVYAVAVGLGMAVIKLILHSAKAGTEFDLMSNLYHAVGGLGRYGYTTFGILPHGLFIGASLVVFVIAVFLISSRRKSIVFEAGGHSIEQSIRESKILKQTNIELSTASKVKYRLVHLVLMILAIYVFSAASIFQGSGWWAPRIVYPIASMVAVLILDLFINDSEMLHFYNWLEKLLLAIIIIIMIFQYRGFNLIYDDTYKISALDQYRYSYIQEAIEEYQDANDILIKKIAFYEDASGISGSDQYSGIYEGTWRVMASAFTTSWSQLEAMNYFYGTSYESADIDRDIKEHFASQDWNTLSAEQLIFEGDTLHVCVY